MMITRDQVLQLVKSKGPIIPSDLTRELKVDTMIVGAFLSELVASKTLKISKAKFGGSPMYYLETQKPGLSKLYNHLNEKDRRAYDALKDAQVLLDEPQTALMRTALRAISDFAIPFKVTFKGNQHLFWRWYLASEDVVKTKVKDILDTMYPAPKIEPKPEEKKTEKIEEIKETKEENKSLEQSTSQPIEEEKKAEEIKEIKETNINPQEQKEEVKSPTQTPEPKTQTPNPEIKKEAQSTLSLKTPKENTNMLELKTKTKQEDTDDEFLNTVEGYLNSLKIKILDSKVIKKKRECDLLLRVPSPVGELIYYAKARNKKKSNEGDIAQAFVEGQLKGLPVLYISPGDIPKKLEEEIPNKYKNMKVLKI